MENMVLSPIARRGLMLVLSSPSGAGKTTVVRQLLARDPHLDVSVSVTTRPPRPGEVEGKDYYFVSLEQFQEYVNQGKFLEYAQVFGNFYGTLQEPVANALHHGRDMIFDVDWQGAQALTQNWRTDLVKIFILPPSFQELERRLKARNQDVEAIVNQRMAKAADEISHWAEYDYVIINHEIKNCVEQVYAILTAERYKRERQLGLVDFVRTLIP
jgi:guanylate kinase